MAEPTTPSTLSPSTALITQATSAMMPMPPPTMWVTIFIISSPRFKVRHTSEQTKDELSCIVALGGTVIDVHVYHEIYGKISAMLNVFSERGIKKFMDGIEAGKSTELMAVTNGYHYHTVRAEEEETLDKIEKVLEEKGYLVKE